MAWTSLCDVSELTADEGKYVEIDGFRLAVFLHEGQISVIDDYCPHAGASLSAGPVTGNCVTCPWHGWSFNLTTGQLRDTPGVTIRTYATRIYHREGKPDLLQVDLPKY